LPINAHIKGPMALSDNSLRITPPPVDGERPTWEDCEDSDEMPALEDDEYSSEDCEDPDEMPALVDEESTLDVMPLFSVSAYTPNTRVFPGLWVLGHTHHGIDQMFRDAYRAHNNEDVREDIKSCL
jgi:hypothetical protein